MAINDHPSDYDQFAKHGHTGKWHSVSTVQNATGSFTGSDYGAGGIIVAESSTTGHIHLTQGGTIDLSKLTVGTVYEFSIKEVANNNKVTYVLKRNPKL